MATDYTATTIASGVAQQSTWNSEFAALQAALARQLNVYGDSTHGTNAMQVDFDMNTYDILNAGTVNASDVVVGGVSISNLYDILIALTGSAPAPVASTYLHRNAANTAYEGYTITQLAADLAAESVQFSTVVIGDSATTLTVNGSAYDLTFAVWDEETTTDYDDAQIHLNDSAGIAGRYLFARGRGTIASPTVVVTGDTLGTISAAGFDGTDYALSSTIVFGTEGTIADDTMPGTIVFKTSPTGSQTPTTAVTINSARDVTFADGDLIFNEGGQVYPNEQSIWARDSSGGGGALERCIILRRGNNDRMALLAGGGGLEIKSYNDVTYWLTFSNTGAATFLNGVTTTIPSVDINGGDIQTTTVGTSSPLAMGARTLWLYYTAPDPVR